MSDVGRKRGAAADTVSFSSAAGTSSLASADDGAPSSSAMNAKKAKQQQQQDDSPCATELPSLSTTRSSSNGHPFSAVTSPRCTYAAPSDGKGCPHTMVSAKFLLVFSPRIACVRRPSTSIFKNGETEHGLLQYEYTCSAAIS